MSALASQIDGVNQAASNLIESGHPHSAHIRQCQDHLNIRYTLSLQLLV